MKSIALLALTLISTTTFANFRDPELDIRFVSWCEKNVVMGEDSEGKPVVKMDCTEFEKVCKTTQVNRPNMTIFFATCEEAN